MPQIGLYSELTSPSSLDQIPMVDISASDELKYITHGGLHHTHSVTGINGVKIVDNAGLYGINLVTGGNVGIGHHTSNGDVGTLPHTALHVHKFRTNDIPILMVEHATDGYDSSIEFRQAGTSQYVAGYDDSADVFKITAANVGGFATNAFTMNDVGNVGVNVANSSVKLEVGGDAKFIDTNSITVDSSVPSLTSNTTLVINASNSQDTNFNSGKLFIDGTNGRVGIGTASPSSTLQVNGTGDILEMYATSGASRIKFNNAGLNAGYIINDTSILAMGGNTIATGGDMLVISKSSGKVNVGGTDFNRHFTVTSTDVITSTFRGSAASDSIILIETTNNNVDRDQIIGFRYNNSGTQNIKWVIGSAYDSTGLTNDYFVFHKPSLSLDLDASIAFSSTLESNTAYIDGGTGDTAGGISSSNTPCCFGEIINDVVQPGDYNIASIVASGSQYTITFTKDLSNTTYTIVGTGYDTGSNATIIGYLSTKSEGTCVIQLKISSGSPDVTQTNFSFALFGAKHKAS